MKRLTTKKPDVVITDESLLARAEQQEPYVLRLFLTGMTPRSTEAYANLKAICETHLHGRDDLEVLIGLDLYRAT